jgi:D-glycero-D-manno-heptose 1,7-bisphosphate phosphatase
VKRGVFLDRDGTLIEEAGYLDRLARIRVFPYTIDAVRLLNRAGLAVIVVSNQSGVARGFFDDGFVQQTHTHLAKMFANGGATIDAFYYCPHHPEGTVAKYQRACDCRKPQSGLLERAARDHGIDLRRSFVVGDRTNDVDAGRAVHAQSVLVRTGYGVEYEAAAGERGAVVVDNLMSAVAWILQQP